MSNISLSVLAAAGGRIHVHVEIVEGRPHGISFVVARTASNLGSFERHFGVSPSSRRDRHGHSWTMSRLMKVWRDAEKQSLDAPAREAFDLAFANGCVWAVVNDPIDPDGARRKLLDRLRSGRVAHVRAIANGKGHLRCRILDAEPGDADDVEWAASLRAIEPVRTPDLGDQVSDGGWGGIRALRIF